MRLLIGCFAFTFLASLASADGLLYTVTTAEQENYTRFAPSQGNHAVTEMCFTGIDSGGCQVPNCYLTAFEGLILATNSQGAYFFVNGFDAAKHSEFTYETFAFPMWD